MAPHGDTINNQSNTFWQLTEPAFDPKTSRAYEGLFTQGSGYLHIRGALEEPLADAPQNV